MPDADSQGDNIITPMGIIQMEPLPPEPPPPPHHHPAQAQFPRGPPYPPAPSQFQAFRVAKTIKQCGGKKGQGGAAELHENLAAFFLHMLTLQQNIRRHNIHYITATCHSVRAFRNKPQPATQSRHSATNRNLVNTVFPFITV